MSGVASRARLVCGSALMILMTAGLVVASPVLAAKIAAKPAPVQDTTPIYTPGQTSAYAHYLVGRYAMAMGDMNAAAEALSAASSTDPADSDLREKAFLINI